MLGESLSLLALVSSGRSGKTMSFDCRELTA